MNPYRMKNKTWSQKFTLFLGVSLLLLSACASDEADSEESASKLESKVETVDSSEAEEEVEVSEVPVESFYEYWTNDDYSYYLDAERLFVYNQTTEDSHRYVVEQQEVKENTLDVTLQDGATLQMTLNGSELEIAGNDQLLYTEAPFEKTAMEKLDLSFLVFMDNDGNIVSDQRDLTIEDFKGYWAPFNSGSSSDALPFGEFAYYIGDNSHLIGYFGSEGHHWVIQDYEITGNTMTVWKENVDYGAVDAFYRGDLDHIEMDLTETKLTLFEEEDRDRLIFHENGQVLLRLPEDELATTSILNQPKEQNLFYTDFDLHATSFMDELAGISESDYTINRKVAIDSSIQLGNYPYSLGELSEEELFKERLILREVIPHLENELDEETAINQLISKSYESTASYAFFDNKDTGFYFSSQLLISQGAVGSVEHKAGVRQNAENVLKTYEVSTATFEDHIYTLLVKEAGTAELSEKFFYRINENVLYEMDADGNFLGRFENGADWEDFEGLPERF